MESFGEELLHVLGNDTECSPIILREEALKIVYTCKKSNLKRLLQCGGEPSAACFRARVETDEFQRFVGRIILLKSKNNTKVLQSKTHSRIRGDMKSTCRCRI